MSSEKKSGSELFIVDNSDKDWKVKNYLHDWCGLSGTIDIATGFFEIGSLLTLDGEWQKVDNIRILMGDEVSRRTKKAFEEGLKKAKNRLDDSLETEKEKNDFLTGVPAIVDAINSGKIKCRVYRKDKFHAKTYITHARQEVIGSFGLVGSSNFTYPGISENVELNVQIAGRQVNNLQEWYEGYWKQAEDVTAEILRTIERHTREYTPFEVYTKALQEFFRGHEMTVSEWEQADSKMFHVLDQYQKEGYQATMKIAQQYNGAFLCDGVGLGKTFIGLMIIERLVMHDRKRVALFVTKAAGTDVWEPAIRRYLPHIGGDFSNLVLFNQTDLGRRGEYTHRFERIKEMADVIIIDEAHHFRNPGIKGTGERRPSRYRLLFDLIEDANSSKQMFLLTATPINNKLDDFRHMIELFSRQQEGYFQSTLGIHSLRGHFIKMERELRQTVENCFEGDTATETNLAEAEQVLRSDSLFQAIVVQRSRDYVKKSQLQQGITATIFPTREAPKVADYSIRKTYGRLLDLIETAFAKEQPLFVLGLYYPLFYYKGDDDSIDPIAAGRQRQVVSLIRTQFLKRFESSAHSFERSCERLFLKLLAWVTKHSETETEKQRLERWIRQHADLTGYVYSHQQEFWEEEENADEDIVTDEMLEAIECLSRDEYKVEEILEDTFLDLDQIAEFINELKKFKPKHDDKLKAIIKLLKNDRVLKKHKILIFSEFAETARYLHEQFNESGIDGVEQIDSGTKRNRSEIIHRFAPYYNETSSPELAVEDKKEIRILISTDILSEGLNLQDATRLINYDLHWNPVRLMQRIGRVDRRMNPEIEEKLLADHPEQKDLRGKIAYWNFLPPDEIEILLGLYTKVSHKTLRISKTFGIEGKKLLRPEDDYDALRDFNHSYEGTTTLTEEMHLEYQKLLKDNPDLESKLNALPGRVFSGKKRPAKGAKAVFFCYRLPRPDYSISSSDDEPPWREEAGETKWYLYDLDEEKILEEPSDIIDKIRSKPDTPRKCEIEQKTLSEIRVKIDKHIKNTYLKKVQAPIGVKPILKAWMELN